MLKTRTLGRTGFEVSEIGFGAWAIGGRGYGPVPDRDAIASLKAYVDQGGNFIDTARAYGESERLIGEFLRQRGERDHLTICSKTLQLEATPIEQDLTETLNQLGTDYVDLYYLHSPPDDPEKINRILDLYEGFKQEGRIRAIGASIKGPNVTRQTVDLCRQYIQTGRVDVLQVIYSIFRQKNAEMFREAAENGVGIVVRTALESGFLTGKYVPGHEFTGNDHRKRWGNKHLNYILQHAEVLKQSSVQPPYKTLSQVAIRFALSPREISTVIVGAKSVGQAENNLSVAALPALDPRIQTRLVETYRDLNETFNTRG